LRKYKKHSIRKANNTFRKIFKKSRHQSDSTCELPPKKPNIEEKKAKKANNFFDANNL